jgi:predicted hotdog family 3-hydroxylacyl-ACP dehydratase
MDIAVEALIPHRGRMALIEELIAVDENSCTTTATVRKSWPLFDGEAVDTLTLVELVAQTACAGGAWRKHRAGKASGGGGLVGLRNGEFYEDRVALHTRLITSTNNLYCLDDYHVFEGTVKAGSTVVCRITIQALRNDQAVTGGEAFHGEG